jgi:putative endonuclease
MFYVYLLISEKDNSHYVGQTDNLVDRLKKHNSGKVLSTKNKTPWKLIKYEEYATRNESRWREYTLKHNSNERKKFYGA